MFYSLIAAALALGAAASPVASLTEKRWSGSCMTDAQATVVANNFRATIAEPFSAAFVRKTFAVGFQDYSDSVNELINAGCPNGPVALGSPTFPSRHAFIVGQGGQQPITFNIIKIWHNCDTVIMRWNTPNPGFVTPEEPVTGIIVIEAVEDTTDECEEPWLIQTVYSEFNSGAWLYDIGNFTPSCSASKAKRTVADLSSFIA